MGMSQAEQQRKSSKMFERTNEVLNNLILSSIQTQSILLDTVRRQNSEEGRV